MIEVKEIIMELKDELAATQKELVAVKDELEFTKNEQLATKDGLSATNDKLVATMEKLLATKEAIVTITTKDELKMLEKEVTIIRDPPHLHMCGSHYDSIYGSNTIITYSNLFYSSTNTEGGGLDITSGVFTAPLG